MSLQGSFVRFISCFAIVLTAFAGQCAAQVTLDTIRKVQSDRAAGVHTLHVVWKQHYTVMNDSHQDNYPRLPISFEGAGELTLSGDNERIALNRELWHGEERRKVRDTEITARGPNSVKTYNPIRLQGTVYEKGSEPPSPKYAELIAAAFTPSPAYLSNPKFALLRRQPSDDKNGLYIVGNTGDTGVDLPGVPQGEEYYLDPAKDFAPVRYTYINIGQVTENIEIEYKRDAKHGWVPKRLKMNSTNRKTGLMDSKRVIKIVKFSPNATVKNGFFDLEFPAGTRVYDRAQEKEYVVEETAVGGAPALAAK